MRFGFQFILGSVPILAAGQGSADDPRPGPQTAPVSLVPSPQNFMGSASGWSNAGTFTTFNGEDVCDFDGGGGSQVNFQIATTETLVSGNQYSVVGRVDEVDAGTATLHLGGGGFPHGGPL